ncbi:hypothetical protein IE81DRAFT_344140 [Ceraceosorus guamensis]|uniref:Uncharacterized protein n=1 Tax=Ceraceosorus guamensis TaxID=1522189 RepID=A0A316W833_9BASI|nr:hypothetical protein IE81DRAFT_344140 [Ceraceosorus guamensis]PWN46076.1 hypothetical protein IE81DRAFT_344140 [Ceraceosorus guamensis]
MSESSLSERSPKALIASTRREPEEALEHHVQAANKYVGLCKAKWEKSLEEARLKAERYRNKSEQDARALKRCQQDLQDAQASVREYKSLVQATGEVFDAAAPKEVFEKVDSYNAQVELLVDSMFGDLKMTGSRAMRRSALHENLHFAMHQHVVVPFVSLMDDTSPWDEVFIWIQEQDGVSVRRRVQAKLRNALRAVCSRRPIKSEVKDIISTIKRRNSSLGISFTQGKIADMLCEVSRDLEDLLECLCSISTDVRENLLEDDYYLVVNGLGIRCALQLKKRSSKASVSCPRAVSTETDATEGCAKKKRSSARSETQDKRQQKRKNEE